MGLFDARYGISVPRREIERADRPLSHPGGPGEVDGDAFLNLWRSIRPLRDTTIPHAIPRRKDNQFMP